MEQELPATGCPNCERLERVVAELKARIEKLEALLEQALRRSKWQAAPFGKGTSKKKPNGLNVIDDRSQTLRSQTLRSQTPVPLFR